MLNLPVLTTVNKCCFGIYNIGLSRKDITEFTCKLSGQYWFLFQAPVAVMNSPVALAFPGVSITTGSVMVGMTVRTAVMNKTVSFRTTE